MEEDLNQIFGSTTTESLSSITYRHNKLLAIKNNYYNKTIICIIVILISLAVILFGLISISKNKRKIKNNNDNKDLLFILQKNEK